GGRVYREAMGRADLLVITEIDVDVEGDTTAPSVPEDFRLTAADPAHGADGPSWHTSRTGLRYRILTHRRCATPHPRGAAVLPSLRDPCLPLFNAVTSGGPVTWTSPRSARADPRARPLEDVGPRSRRPPGGTPRDPTPPGADMSTLSRRTLVTSTAALSAAGVGAPAAPRSQARPPSPHRPDPSFEDVSVHDPSVVVADGCLYVFGSHLAAARSRDLQRWTSVADLVTPENPLFEDVTEELSEALEWARSTTLWAPDVHATEDGRYRMYYCACEGPSPRSAMGTAIADDVEGPYRDEGIF